MHLSFTKPQLQQLHVTDFSGKRRSRSGTELSDGQNLAWPPPLTSQPKNGIPWHKGALPRKPCKAQCLPWYPSEEQPPPLGQQLFEDRIPEWFRLERTTGAHPVPLPCSSRVPWSSHSGLCPDGFGVSPGKETPQTLWAAVPLLSHLTAKKFFLMFRWTFLCF